MTAIDRRCLMRLRRGQWPQMAFSTVHPAAIIGLGYHLPSGQLNDINDLARQYDRVYYVKPSELNDLAANDRLKSMRPIGSAGRRGGVATRRVPVVRAYYHPPFCLPLKKNMRIIRTPPMPLYYYTTTLACVSRLPQPAIILD